MPRGKFAKNVSTGIQGRSAPKENRRAPGMWRLRGSDATRVARLRGMFAFALFEATPAPPTALGQRPLSSSPLHYHDSESASSFHAFLRRDMVPHAADPEPLIQFSQVGS